MGLGQASPQVSVELDKQNGTLKQCCQEYLSVIHPLDGHQIREKRRCICGNILDIKYKYIPFLIIDSKER